MLKYVKIFDIKKSFDSDTSLESRTVSPNAPQVSKYKSSVYLAIKCTFKNLVYTQAHNNKNLEIS